MPDVATIGAFLGSVKTAADIAKALRGADVSLEKAELKLKLAELIEALAEAKMQAADIQEIIREKDGEINNLKKAFEFKFDLVRKGNAYYLKATSGGFHTEEAFCSHCWEVNQKSIHLSTYLNDMSKWVGECPSCKNKYDLEGTFDRDIF